MYSNEEQGGGIIRLRLADSPAYVSSELGNGIFSDSRAVWSGVNTYTGVFLDQHSGQRVHNEHSRSGKRLHGATVVRT